MGNAFSWLLASLFGDKEARILILGLDVRAGPVLTALLGALGVAGAPRAYGEGGGRPDAHLMAPFPPVARRGPGRRAGASSRTRYPPPPSPARGPT